MKLSSPQLASFLRVAGWATLAIAVAICFRLSVWPSVFHHGGVYFVDGDCYSRMTRAAMVFHGEAFSIRQHAFENHPNGTLPHTTGLLDWLIAGFALLLKLFCGLQALDFAGAWIGPILGAGAVIVLLWSLWGHPNAWMALLFFAASPILAHGNSLGRPDHQALQIFLLTAFLGMRWRVFQEKPSRNEAVLAGITLGLALWVSLYEPAILAALFLLLELVFNSKRLFVRERIYELAALIAVAILAVIVDGVRWSPPDASPGSLFSRWAPQIGELRSIAWNSALLQSWIGWAGFVSAAAAGWLSFAKRNLRLAAWLLAWIALFALTCVQIRWGYFLAISTVFLIVDAFDWIPSKWGRGLVFVLLLWPMWQHWRGIWSPDQARQEMMAEQQKDAHLAREAANFLKQNSESGAGVLAPWWLCPPLAYWSGLPCVAGSSHQSLPGIEATARFYLEQDATAARQILDSRKAIWVVAYEPDRIYQTAVPLVSRPGAASSMATILYERTNLAPRFLRLGYVNDFFRIYRVQPRHD